LTPPLVSVNIPTFNSAKTLPTTLKSVAEQSYPAIEVIVADSYSNDETTKIVSEFGAKLVRTKDKLLGARIEAFSQSQGTHVLLLDSDQVLDPTTIERCVASMDRFDMLMLEEDSYSPETWIQRLFQADRRMLSKIGRSQFDPYTGSMLPRFYRRTILGHALEKIPSQLLRGVIAHDHAIIYFEASRVSMRVGLVPKAIYSTEPANLLSLWTKNFRYGRSVTCLRNSPYWSLVWNKTRFRAGRHRLSYGSSSTALLFLKSFAYVAGFATSDAMKLLSSNTSRQEKTVPSYDRILHLENTR